MDNCIILKKPEIHYTDVGTVRMTADIIEPNKPVFHSFVEVEKEYAQYLTPERADYLLYIAFIVAIREGYDIVCEAPVTESLLHNMREILIPSFLVGDKNSKNFKIIAKTDATPIGGTAVGTTVSCGVDSTYAIMKYSSDEYPSLKLTHLFIGSLNVELWQFDEEKDNIFTWQEKHSVAFKRIEKASEMTKLPLVKVFTNLVYYGIKRDWTTYHHGYTHQFITMSSVLALKKLWKTFLFPSAVDFVSYFPCDHWITDDPEHRAIIAAHTLSVPDFQYLSGGGCVSRLDKTRELMDYDVARKVLHPCHQEGEKNCTNPWCHKCVRALFVFDYYDKLDEMSEVFDIEKYKRDKQKFFWHLAKNRKDDFLGPLYDMMMEKYPDAMKKATQSYENWAKPILREDWDILQGAYNNALKLLSVDGVKEKVLQFFSEKGIQKLYTSSSSNFGKILLSFIENDIETCHYQTGKVEECDAALILSNSPSEIKKNRENLEKRTSNMIYTISDIVDYVTNSNT